MGKTIGRNFNITPPDVGARWLAAIATTACAALAGFSSSVYADTATAQTERVGARLQSNSVSISTSGAVNINIIPSATGTLAVGKSTVNVETTATSGYQLYVSGLNVEKNDNLTALYYNGHADGISKLIGIGNGDPTAFSEANAWGFAIGDDDNSYGFSTTRSYEDAINLGSIVDRATISNLKWQGLGKQFKLIKTASSSSATDVYYGVYVDNNVMTGDYYNSVVYTAFVDGTNRLEMYPYVLSNGDTTTITVEYRSSTVPVTDPAHIKVALLDNERSVGTCDNIAITNNGSTGLLEFTCDVNTNANFYSGKAFDVAVDVDFDNREGVVSFRADDVWGNNLSLAEFETMQDATAVACANSPLHSVYHLKDSRTDASYLVTKMADGNCWMTQNLWLDENQTYVGSNGVGTFDTSGSLNFGWTYNSASGTQFYTGTHIDNTVDDYYDATSRPTGKDNTGSFFTWKKATADTGGGYGENGIATNSVCPQGWKLPTGGENGDFDKLYTIAYGSNHHNFNAVWHASLVGSCRGAVCNNNQNRNAYWWSSTQGTNENGRYLSMDNSLFYTTNGGNKGNGYLVRCMLETDKTMQSFTVMDANKLPTDATIALRDERDDKSYLVAKMRDGKVWMVQNLAIEPGTELTPSNSNVGINYTIPSTANFNDNTAQDAIAPSHINAVPNNKDDNTGGYYTWLAATANSGAGLSAVGTEAEYSICPRGWRLPLRDDGLMAMYNSYTGGTAVADFQSSWRGALVGGYYDDGALTSNGSNGYWWSRGTSNDEGARIVYQDNLGVFQTDGYNKRRGFSVRCVFDPQN